MIIQRTIYALLAAAVIFAGLQTARLGALQSRYDAFRGDVAAERMARAAEALRASERFRAEEARRSEAVAAAAMAAQAAGRRDRVAAAGARAAGDGLRIAARAVVAACDPAGQDTTPAADSPATGPAGGEMLANVLRLAADAAIDMAAIADERGTAGSACVSAYDALTHE